MSNRLTELEATALAVIWRLGSCSPYAVMQVFRASPTPEWGSSAGAIYPAIARLEQRGLIESETQDWGRRGKKALRLSASGMAAVRDWVREVAGRAGEITPDPARTRIYFLDVVSSPEEQLALVDEAEREAAASLATLDQRRDAQDDFESFGDAGTRYALQARIEWLRDIRGQLAARLKNRP